MRILAFSVSITCLAGGGLWISSLPDPSVASPVNARLANLPVQFVPNEGQVDARVAYYVKGRTTAVFFTRDGVYYRLRGESGKPELTRLAAHREEAAPAAWNVKLEFLDPNPNVRLRAGTPSGAVVSYFRGPRENWPAGLTAYSAVIYEEIWPGIDLEFAGPEGNLKYTFHVKPEAARPGDVRHSRACTQRAKSELGFEARVSLEEGLQTMQSHWKAGPREL